MRKTIMAAAIAATFSVSAFAEELDCSDVKGIGGRDLVAIDGTCKFGGVPSWKAGPAYDSTGEPESLGANPSRADRSYNTAEAAQAELDGKRSDFEAALEALPGRKHSGQLVTVGDRRLARFQVENDRDHGGVFSARDD